MPVEIQITHNLDEVAKAIKKLPDGIDRRLLSVMGRIVQKIRTDVLMRVTKPRTGYKKFTARRAGNIRTHDFQTSGPPQYPQVLSRMFGGLASSISSVIDENRDGKALSVIGKVGVERNPRSQTAKGFFYPAFHELSFRNGARQVEGVRVPIRAFLRPSLLENHQMVSKEFASAIDAALGDLQVEFTGAKGKIKVAK